MDGPVNGKRILGTAGRQRSGKSPVAAAFSRARETQELWREVPLAKRVAAAGRLRGIVAERAGDLAESVGRGRRPCAPPEAIAETLASEVLPLADACRFLERRGERLLRSRRLGRGGRPLWLLGTSLEVIREPHGVVLVVAPRNYPLFLAGVQAAQAAVAGNAVLWKPAPGGSPVAHLMASLFLEAGFPAGLVSILAEDIETAVEAVEQGPDKVVVTGSFEAGASIVSRLAPSVVPATLELGGCDAVFVRRDADVDLASRALTFGLAFAGGETCIAPRRVFAARELSDELEARLATAVGALAARPLRRAAVEKAAELIRDACERGARPAAGTHPVPAEGRMRPVVLAGVAPGMRVLSEDVLAPLLAIVPVRDDEQALRLASACPYALGAAVFGKEAGAVALARRVNAGTAIVNDVIVPTADPRLPFSGRGRSGHGVTRGAEGLLEMTRIKALSVRRSFRRHLDAVPPVRERDDLFLLYIQAAHAPGLRARVRAAVSLGRLLARSRERRAGEFGARS